MHMQIMKIPRRSCLCWLCLPSLAMPQTANRQGGSKPHHTIVPLPEEWPKKHFEEPWEVISGDPDKAGAPFVIRMYNLENQVAPPHWHPEDEHLTIVKGSWYVGDGETFDRAALREMNDGDYVLVPKTMPHFGWAKTALAVQIHGIGPFKINLVDPWMLLTDPNAASRFKYRLNDRVRSSRGEGVVRFGFSSDKNRVTQYYVERADGSQFAEFEEELAKVR
jgi:hypothetical protein